jgi:hypothetical protein
LFNTILPYCFVQRNRNRTEGRASWLYEDVYKFFIHSPNSRRKYLVEVHAYPDHLYTVDFYAKVHDVNRYRLRTNQRAMGKLGGTVLNVIAGIVRADPQACFGFIAAAMLDETNDNNTRRFQVYTKMLELKIDPTRYKVAALEQNSSIFVLPKALAAQPNTLQQIINRYDGIFRETF